MYDYWLDFMINNKFDKAIVAATVFIQIVPSLIIQLIILDLLTHDLDTTIYYTSTLVVPFIYIGINILITLIFFLMTRKKLLSLVWIISCVVISLITFHIISTILWIT